MNNSTQRLSKILTNVQMNVCEETSACSECGSFSIQGSESHTECSETCFVDH